MGKIWERKAPAMGYDIAYHADFASRHAPTSARSIAKAKASGAEIVVARTPPARLVSRSGRQNEGRSRSFPRSPTARKAQHRAAFRRRSDRSLEGTATTNFYKPSTDPIAQQLDGQVRQEVRRGTGPARRS